MTNPKKNKQAEALTRALTGQTWSNYPAIFKGLTAKGISENDIQPRENVFTYQAWQALGRQVRKGERGVKILTYIPVDKKAKDADNDDETKVKHYSVPRSVSVFHISQTDAKVVVTNAAI